MCSKGYRYDAYERETDVYDESCSNCANRGCSLCPLWLRSDDDEELTEIERIKDAMLTQDEKLTHKAAVEQRRKEDGVMSKGELTWCVNWRGRRGYR